MSYLITILITIVSCIVSLSITVVHAQGEGGGNINLEDTEKKPEIAGSVRDFAGLRFGVGLSLTVDTGSNDRIDNAQIVDGVVRVDKETNSIATIMLESHYFFQPITKGFWGLEGKQLGVGPFVAIQPGTSEIIEAIGAGIMIGFKRMGEIKDTSSWNFGIGVRVDPNAKVLGDGFEENKPPPGTETQVRFKETSQVGVLFLSSFSF